MLVATGTGCTDEVSFGERVGAGAGCQQPARQTHEESCAENREPRNGGRGAVGETRRVRGRRGPLKSLSLAVQLVLLVQR